jgi:hypothetical protein
MGYPTLGVPPHSDLRFTLGRQIPPNRQGHTSMHGGREFIHKILPEVNSQRYALEAD